MVKFKITPYTKEGNIMLVREETKTPSPGLPPTYSSVILMNDDEINDLMKVLQEYGDQRRNS